MYSNFFLRITVALKSKEQTATNSPKYKPQRISVTHTTVPLQFSDQQFYKFLVSPMLAY
jgi:hypothetical protein